MRSRLLLALRIAVPAGMALGLAACKPASTAASAADSTATPPDAPAPPVDSTVTLAEAAKRLRVSITYPQLPGGPDALNAAIRDSARALAQRFAANAEAPSAELPAEMENASEGGVATFHASDRVVSGRFEVLEMYAGAAHPNHVASAFTFDRTTGRAVALADLFQDGTPYLDSLSAQSRRQLRARFAPEGVPDEDSFLEGTKPAPESFAVFTVHPDGLHLYFPHYTLGPYAFGAHEAVLPWAGLRPMLRAGGVAP